MNKTKADNLPESWIKTTLYKILSENLQPGFAQNPKDGGDVGQIRTHNVSPDGSIDLNGLKFVFPSEKEFKKYTLKKGDIVFNNTNSDEWVGKTALYELEEEYLFSNHMTRIRVNTSLAKPEYIAKYLHFLWMKGYSRSKSKQWVNQSGIEQSILASFSIPLPPLAEQKQIVAILQEADALRRKKKEILEKSNRLASALFLEMFGDPVRNEKGWEVNSLSKFGYYKNGLNYGANETGVTVKCIGVGDFKNLYKIETIDSLTSIQLAQNPSDEYLLKDEDLLFVRSNGNKELVGRCIVVYPGQEKVTFSGFCIRFRKNNNLINIIYILYLFRIPTFKSTILFGGKGANIQNISQKVLEELKIPFPPLPLQNDFAKKVEAIEDTTKQIESSLRKMEKLYDSLLQKAFTGDLTESWRMVRHASSDAAAHHDSKDKMTERKCHSEQACTEIAECVELS